MNAGESHLEFPERRVMTASAARAGKVNLDRRIIELTTRRKWNITSRSETHAQLEKGKPTSHLFHLAMSVITAGLWLPVWFAVTVVGGHKTKLLTIDEEGTLIET